MMNDIQILYYMNSNQQGPLSPQQLLSRLTNNDFREAECQDESSRIRQQREILIQLILEYEDEIKKAHLLSVEEEKLIELREKMLVELEALRKERLTIDSKITEELRCLRVAPREVKDQAVWVQEINESRSRNTKLKIRIRDLIGYIEKLEFQNRRLEEERRVIQVSEVQRRQTGDDWRVKIDTLKREHLSYETDIREKIRVKEEVALRNIQSQQLQIRQRNQRRRMESLSGKPSTPIHAVYNSRYVREI